MTLDWRPLQRELSLWARDSLTLPIWWRDDDAITTTPQLDQLAALARRLALPVHLAVIPSLAEPSLAADVAADPYLIPLVHGWSHANHAPAGQKKAEFGAHRPLPAMLRDCTDALARATTLLGARAVMVPPWNRISTDLTTRLPHAGYTALSTFGPRDAPLAAPGLVRINTHLDPVDWHGTRSLADPDRLIAQITGQLGDRRAGRADNSEPYGLLTHHLIHDAALWSFAEDLMRCLCDGPVTHWSAHDLPDPTQHQPKGPPA